jgi:hypothetical protein
MAKKPPRGRRPLPEAERKAKVVQTRVPEVLEDALRKEAKQQRLSVSQLIRNVLEDTFTLVENVVAKSTDLGKTIKRDALRIAASAKGRSAEPDGDGKAEEHEEDEKEPEPPAPAGRTRPKRRR